MPTLAHNTDHAAARLLWTCRRSGTVTDALQPKLRPNDPATGNAIQASLPEVAGQAVIGGKIAAASATSGSTARPIPAVAATATPHATANRPSSARKVDIREEFCSGRFSAVPRKFTNTVTTPPGGHHGICESRANHGEIKQEKRKVSTKQAVWYRVALLVPS
ncbi:MAG: hypothetical protein H7242_14175 [Microbacteriaceae bacterium]|nr:hypothetical protein [Burkholderiaceae bacterium]